MPFAAALLVAALQAAPAAKPSSPPPPPPVTATPAPPPQTEAYTYQPDGRRDPFVSLLGTGVDTRVPGKRGDGAAGLTVGEISVRGVIESRGTLIAMVSGPDKKTYIVHAGDRLVDGTIRSITAEGLVITQEVTDPLSLVKQREVRKGLRSVEQSKE